MSKIIYNSQVQLTNKVLILLMFVVYPIIALPFIFIEIYNNRKYAYSCLALFFGFIALLFPPTGDLYRYTQDYYNYYGLDFIQFVKYVEFKIDYIHPFFLWSLGKLDINCDFSRFIYVWISSELVFRIFYNFSFLFVNKKKRFRLFIILLLLLSFNTFLYRYGFSLILFAYGSYLIICKNERIKGYVFILLSVLNHFSFIVFLLAFVFQDVFNYKGDKRIAIFCIICSFIFSTDIISQMIQKLPFGADFANHLLIYTEGYYAGEFYEDHSFHYKIGVMLQKTNYIVLALFYCLNFKQSKLSGWITILLIILFLFSPFPKIKSRFEGLLSLTSCLYLLDYYATNQIKSSIKILKVLLYVGVFYTCICTWIVRRQLSLSMEEKLLLPTYYIVTSSYSKEWINKNVLPDGSPIVNY